MANVLTGNLQPIPILVYHQIDQAPPKGSPFRSLYVAPAAFARQMLLLKLLGYTGLSMTGLQPYLSGERTGKVVGITFDDGYLNNLKHALPVLVRYGFSSTCYAVSNLIGQTNVWDEGIGIAQTALMNKSQIQQWLENGQEIGSHTSNHVNMSEINDETCHLEITHGKTDLETVAMAPVQHFCYPYGRYESKHCDMVRAQGFETATTTRRSRCHNGTHMYEIPRIPVVRSTTLPQFWLKFASSYEDRRK